MPDRDVHTIRDLIYQYAKIIAKSALKKFLKDFSFLRNDITFIEYWLARGAHLGAGIKSLMGRMRGCCGLFGR
jgi:hypothetical protein